MDGLDNLDLGGVDVRAEGYTAKTFESCAGRNSEVAKGPPLPLWLALRAFQPLHNGLSKGFIFLGFPPDPNKRRSTIVLNGCGCDVRSMGEAVA